MDRWTSAALDAVGRPELEDTEENILSESTVGFVYARSWVCDIGNEELVRQSHPVYGPCTNEQCVCSIDYAAAAVVVVQNLGPAVQWR